MSEQAKNTWKWAGEKIGIPAGLLFAMFLQGQAREDRVFEAINHDIKASAENDKRITDTLSTLVGDAKVWTQAVNTIATGQSLLREEQKELREDHAELDKRMVIREKNQFTDADGEVLRGDVRTNRSLIDRNHASISAIQSELGKVREDNVRIMERHKIAGGSP